MKIAYDAPAQLQEEEEGKLNFTTSEYMQETQALLTPDIKLFEHQRTVALSLSKHEPFQI